MSLNKSLFLTNIPVLFLIIGAALASSQTLGTPFQSSPKSTQPVPDTRIFKQCLNHFDSNGCNITWNQRYFVRDDYYQPGGPIFLLVGGQGNGADWHNGFSVGEYVEEYNGKYITLEHRFYGESIPIINATVDDLERYHGTQHALADLAYFIDTFKLENNLTEAQWVLFGGSYSSSLAIWFTQLYPGRITAGVFSAGPLMFEYEFPEAAELISKMLKELDSECFDVVHEIFGCMESIVNGTGCFPYNGTSDMLNAIQYEQSCETIDFQNPLEAEKFFFNLFNPWVAPPLFLSLKSKCDILHGINSSDILNKYGQFLNSSGFPTCPQKNHYYKRNSPVTTDINDDIFYFNFQICNEIGTYYTSDPKYGLFGYNTFSGEAWGQDCLEFFGPKYTREYVESRIEYTNSFYKGFNITSKCGIFVSGTNDPWFTYSIHDPGMITEDNSVIIIPNGEHLAETSEIFFNPEVLEARRQIKAQLGVYLQDPSCRP